MNPNDLEDTPNKLFVIRVIYMRNVDEEKWEKNNTDSNEWKKK